MALAYSFATILVIDKDIAGNEALKESREMMRGHKWEYFIFILSFIGWLFLVPFTLDILLIWLVPYILIVDLIYYENLKKIEKKGCREIK